MILLPGALPTDALPAVQPGPRPRSQRSGVGARPTGTVVDRI